MQVRGRYLVFGWTAVFAVAAGSIVLRTRSGFVTRRHVDSLEAEIRVLESSRADFESSLEKFKGRAVLVAKAQALGLRFTSDSDLVILNVPGGH
jgi:hypothetical protein